ncbi:hypothetical protein KJ575_02670 [Patescibacteria group bacterium]|nr:hypothetical protein [Patescibacteria group bacterium]
MVFNKNTLRTLEKKHGALNANIKYWLKQKKIIGLKNGVYVLTDKYRQTDDKGAYLEYIANQLVMPSYLSAEYVLSRYQILSEPVNALTSITTKTGREIINDLASFRYYSLNPRLFTGYRIKYFQGAPIFEAEKSKALFDFLYLRFLSRLPVNTEVLDALRLNWENISAADFKRAAGYLKLADSRRLTNLFELIKKQYYA